MMDYLKYLGFKKNMEDTNKNAIEFLPLKTPKTTEFYRVGITDNGMTTLTLIDYYGNTMTSTMSKEACKQLIKMLRATYDYSEEE